AIAVASGAPETSTSEEVLPAFFSRFASTGFSCFTATCFGALAINLSEGNLGLGAGTKAIFGSAIGVSAGSEVSTFFCSTLGGSGFAGSVFASGKMTALGGSSLTSTFGGSGLISGFGASTLTTGFTSTTGGALASGVFNGFGTSTGVSRVGEADANGL